MYELLFELLFQTEPVFNNFFLDWLLPAAIVFFLYDFTFGIVGDMYDFRFIKSREAGSFFHWLIRYGLMWIIVHVIILIRDNIKLIISFSVITTVIVFLIFLIIKIRK